jgi:surface protein
MQYMFAYTQQFNWYLSTWDVHNVTNMKGMFEGAQKFDNNGGGTVYHTSSIGVWNVSKVTDMSHMFEGSPCNQDISGWDVSNVTDMSRMFYNDKAFNQPLKNWKTKTAKVKDMREMFYGASAFNQDVSTWTVASVQNMSRMFYNATSYNYASNDWRPTDITNSKDCTRLSEIFKNTKLSCDEVKSMISDWGLKGVCTANQLRGSTDCD